MSDVQIWTTRLASEKKKVRLRLHSANRKILRGDTVLQTIEQYISQDPRPNSIDSQPPAIIHPSSMGSKRMDEE